MKGCALKAAAYLLRWRLRPACGSGFRQRAAVPSPHP